MRPQNHVREPSRNSFLSSASDSRADPAKFGQTWLELSQVDQLHPQSALKSVFGEVLERFGSRESEGEREGRRICLAAESDELLGFRARHLPRSFGPCLQALSARHLQSFGIVWSCVASDDRSTRLQRELAEEKAAKDAAQKNAEREDSLRRPHLPSPCLKFAGVAPMIQDSRRYRPTGSRRRGLRDAFPETRQNATGQRASTSMSHEIIIALPVEAPQALETLAAIGSDMAQTVPSLAEMARSCRTCFSIGLSQAKASGKPPRIWANALRHVAEDTPSLTDTALDVAEMAYTQHPTCCQRAPRFC